MDNVISRRLAAKGITIIYEDEVVLVINKPAPYLVLPDRFEEELPNIYSLLNDLYGKIYVVHRLDRETSGVIVFAKTADAHAMLSGQFTSHTVIKTYNAIVYGCPPHNEGSIELPIGEGARGKMRIDNHAGKPSVTKYRILERFQGYTQIEVQPLTGRTHQIRVHLSASGMPILCDTLYGKGIAFFLSSIKLNYKQKDIEEQPLLSRTALHAAAITFSHPVSMERMTFSAPLPKDMSTVLKYLRKFRT